MKGVTIQPVAEHEVRPWLLVRHYARRLCPISYAFGAFRGPEMIGVVTYGVPASAPLRSGVCGADWADRVLELNRLCCNTEPNLAGVIVSASLRQLPRPSVVVSYADTAQGHVGYVYQACNFLYTGLSAKRTDWKVEGLEHLHGATIADQSRGKSNRVEYMRQKHGDKFHLKDRSRKHRYVFFCGTPRHRKYMRRDLRYPVQPYPKGASQRYNADYPVALQSVLTLSRPDPVSAGEGVETAVGEPSQVRHT